MIIFDGYRSAEVKEASLRAEVAAARLAGKSPKVAAILFSDDPGSQLYTQLKQRAAQRVGIEYEIYTFSMRDPVQIVLEQLQRLNLNDSVTGIIIQKPWRSRWEEVVGDLRAITFADWWTQLTSQIAEAKDVDGLHPRTLAAVEQGTWQQEGRVLPATVRAVLEILQVANAFSPGAKIAVIGRSDILGKPLFYELRNRGIQVELLGKQQLSDRMQSGQMLLDFDVVISATGSKHLVTLHMVKTGVTLVDVGEPQPDINPEGMEQKASFMTPVPGGVGPMTVVSLLENSLELMNYSS